jgi:hypothetical protein
MISTMGKCAQNIYGNPHVGSINSFERSLELFFGGFTAHERRKMCGVRGPNAVAIRKIAWRYGVRNGTPAAPPPGDVDASLSRVPCESISARICVFSSRFEKGPKSAL